jgi:hypothetical protein
MAELDLRHEETETAAVAPEAAMPSLAPTSDELRRVRRSLRFLSRRNPARRLAEAALAGERPEPELVREVLTRVYGFSALRFVEQELAVWALGTAELTEDERQQAVIYLAWLVELGWNSWRTNALEFLGKVAATVVAQALCLAVATRLVQVSDVGLVLAGVIGIGAALVLILTLVQCFRVLALCTWQAPHYRSRCAAIIALGRLAESRSAPALARALHYRSAAFGCEAVRRAARRAIPGVLRTLSEEDRGWLDQSTVTLLGASVQDGERLCRRAHRMGLGRAARTEEHSVPSLLDALGRIGDGSVLRVVKRAAARGPTSSIREAALGVLPAIRERSRNAQDAARLLRPAIAPETLLRPASGPGEADPAMLLRPTDGTEAMSDG